MIKNRENIMLMDTKKVPNIFKVVYLTKASSYTAAAIGLAALCYFDTNVQFLWWVIAVMLLAPHIEFYISAKYDRYKQYDFLLVSPGGLLIGASIATIHFQLIPSAVLLVFFYLWIGSLGGFSAILKFTLMVAIGIISIGFFREPIFIWYSTHVVSAIFLMLMFAYAIYISYKNFDSLTKLRNAKNKLNQANSELKNISNLVNAASMNLEFSKLMQPVGKVFKDNFNFDIIIVRLLDVNQEYLEVYGVYGEWSLNNYNSNVHSLKVNVNAPDGLAAVAYRSAKPIYLHHIHPDDTMYPIDKKIYHLWPYQSILFVPIILQRRIMGVVTLICHEKNDDFSQKAIQQVQNYITHLSISINNAILYEKVLKDREQLHKKSKQLEKLSKNLARYLSPKIYDVIFTGKQQVTAKRKYLTIFVSDIVGFTTLTDKIEAEEVTIMLNLYLTRMSEVVIRYGGTIDKYIGDSIVAFFGDPDSQGEKEDALSCVKMALDMQMVNLQLQQEWEEKGISESMQVRMGVHSGYCLVGNLGSNKKLDYTIIGSTMNVANALEQSCEPGGIHISADTYALVKHAVACGMDKAISLPDITSQVYSYYVKHLR